jgi:23S rRNA (guanine745-N1)-methyltransferase
VVTWQELPVVEGAAGLILNVFAPRNAPEFRRVLRRDGALIVVTPAWDHVTELVAALGLLQVKPSKPDRVAGALSGYLAKQEHTTHTKQLLLRHADVLTLVEMGPNACTPIAMRCSTG